MSVKIKGQIKIALPETSGTSKSGNPWRKREYVLETEGQYPKKIAFSVMNDKIESLNLYVGANVEVSLNIESREFEGRWFTSVTAFASTPIRDVQPQSQLQPDAPPYSNPPSHASVPPAQPDDDLPF